jgi:hypothetical protein
MTEDEAESTGDQPTALLIIPGGGGKAEKALAKFLQMILECSFNSVTEAGAYRLEADRLGSGLTFAASISDDGWSCEWRLPWQATGIDPTNLERLLFNIGVRKTGANGGWVVWEGTGVQNYVVNNAGNLVMITD